MNVQSKWRVADWLVVAIVFGVGAWVVSLYKPGALANYFYVLLPSVGALLVISHMAEQRFAQWKVIHLMLRWLLILGVVVLAALILN